MISVAVEFSRLQAATSQKVAKIIAFNTVINQHSYDADDVADLAFLVGKAVGVGIAKVEMDGSNLINGGSVLVSWDDTNFVLNSAITVSGGERIFILYYGS